MSDIPPRHTPPLNLSAIGLGAIPSPSAASLQSAQDEAAFYAADKKKQGHKRDQRSKDVVHYGTLCLVVLTAVCVAAGLVTWTLHQVLPTTKHWLSKEQVDSIGKAGALILSGTVGALGSKFLARNSEPE